ncbi:hypothetical protein BT96DRAFT_915735 [Gymnopus androsaceus JB14]|uniref:HIT-type domain-containing protein n=1 Tax=Gymnopus androsaceus JB14 TaxID=1447944 RepID=A0A6A4I840_9AGAR|nr:hypothetical protein BT96DRAFT_915735 [Gymnopus androsaceus JB14]
MSETASSAPGSSRTLCTICNARYAIYTCPRCKIKTCSLPCSSSHKSTMNCSGERDKAAFVNLKEYGWGTMMSDYTYLEEVGRKVEEWGAVIGKGSYANNNHNTNQTWRGRGGKPRGPPKTKRDILKAQLEMRDIFMDLLPVGMERRQHNQSSWDFKNQTANLTIEFRFYPPRESKQSSFTLFTHRNNLNLSLLSIIRNQVQERRNLELKKAKGKQKANAEAEAEEQSVNSFFPPWLLQLVEEIPMTSSTTPISQDDTMFSPFDSFIRAPISPISLTITGTRPKAAFHRVIPTEPLLAALRNTHFVEFPTLELWPQGEFSGVVADQDAETHSQGMFGMGQQLVYERGDLVESSKDVERRAKRRKDRSESWQEAISGLLGGYRSNDESDQEEEKEEVSNNGLSLLGGYADSDEEDGGKLEDSDEEEEVELSHEAIVAGRMTGKEDERMDWGDEDSEGEAAEDES